MKNWCGTYKLNPDKTYTPCTTEEWCEQIEQMAREGTKHVNSDEIEDKWVSTVWLGLDHQWDDDKQPLLYETMIFVKEGEEIYCSRYSTWKEAEEGHKHAIQWVLNGCKDEEKFYK